MFNNKKLLIHFFVANYDKNIGLLGRQYSININLIKLILNKNVPVIIRNVQEESLPCVFKKLIAYIKIYIIMKRIV